jgi:lipopolysaccharide biosynthesis glycosyltransferase
MHPIAIAFCADKTMEASLHVAARSALANINPVHRPHIYAMVERFSQKDKALLIRTLDLTRREYDLTFLEPTPNIFAGLPGLHGQLSCYFRLLLPGAVKENRLLYLDADMLIRCDLSPLFALDMGHEPLGAVIDETVGNTLDKDLRVSLHQSLTDPAFNSGALLFDCAIWRERELLKECLRFGLEYRKQIRVVDQSILNALFAKNCVRLPGQYNAKIFNHIRHVPTEGVLHYVGSPKPWDLGAKLILPYARAWFSELRKTALPVTRRNPWLMVETWRRFPKILGGYRRMAVRRLQR